MTRVVELPPPSRLAADGYVPGGWWHTTEEEGRIVCDLCPRECHLKPGDRGFCFVRENVGGEMFLSTYGKSTGFCLDPIEKKPLNHFYPGTSVLSFGTAGCNLGCKFCQNWSISKSREVERLSELAGPEAIAQAALQFGSRSVAFTYNDPVIWAEYAIDTAKACRAVGVKTVAVTAGYISPAARRPFYDVMDAANVDLKGFTEDFYYKLTSSHIAPVLDTLRWLKHETNVWFEITNLIIPRANDSSDELQQMCDWILNNCGDGVPVHFTAFHPDFKLTDREPTPPETLLRAYEIATRTGLKFPYVGNIQSQREQTTYCPNCRQPLIQRSGYYILQYDIDNSRCRHCHTSIAGHFENQPGDWGPRRQPVRISDFQQPLLSLAPQGKAIMSETKPLMEPATSETAPMAVPKFSPEQDNAILTAAAGLLTASVLKQTVQLQDPVLADIIQLPVLGVFVTAKRGGHLRGCCGSFGEPMPLLSAIAQAAARTATDDHRFPPIVAEELPFLDLDVWILHSIAPVSAAGEARKDVVQIGKHGLTIARGQQRGLLLPGVAIENNLDAEGFLRQVCLKANLPPTAWKDSDVVLETFEGHEIAGSLAALVPGVGHDVSPQFSAEDVQGLAAFCRENIFAHLQRATPSYFAFGLPDGNVSGVILTLRVDELRWAQTHRISLREGLPLQSTLSSFAESLAQGLARSVDITAEEMDQAHVELTILTDAAVHGRGTGPDLRGIDPSKRGVMALERGKSGFVYDPALSTVELVQQALELGQIVAPESTALFSLRVQTNARRAKASNTPQPIAGEAVRPPAVAGTFYPADPEELRQLVDQCLSAYLPQPEVWPAVMVPHAGLIYSGKLAAQTFERVKIPGTVIVIGPKHTPQGVEWSVAPHAVWQLPGAEIAADPELAQKLAEAIPGLLLDAAAHHREHGVEVELPFLARLAPQVRVVGIAIGTANLQRCKAFAAGLASVIRQMPEPPLLVISSDMNHYATDEENRRLDAIALEAMESLDPEKLFNTVQEQQISMCGVMPAVIVMETLKLLGGLTECRRVGYATSAEVSKDTSRVVGYAGMLLK